MRSRNYVCAEYESLKMVKPFRVSRAAEEEAFKSHSHLHSQLLCWVITMQRYARTLKDGFRIHAMPDPNLAATKRISRRHGTRNQTFARKLTRMCAHQPVRNAIPELRLRGVRVPQGHQIVCCVPGRRRSSISSIFTSAYQTAMERDNHAAVRKIAEGWVQHPFDARSQWRSLRDRPLLLRPISRVSLLLRTQPKSKIRHCDGCRSGDGTRGRNKQRTSEGIARWRIWFRESSRCREP